MHFVPQAKYLVEKSIIFWRRHRYYRRQLPPISVATSDASWQLVFAISGVGGVIVTAGYGLYLTIQYQYLINDSSKLKSRVAWHKVISR